MTTIRLFFLSLLCCSAWSTLTAQQGYILQFPVGTTQASVNTVLSSGGGTGSIVESVPMFGLFLVRFKGLSFKGTESCKEITEALKKVCPNCQSPTASSPTGIQGGGGINYVTFNPTAIKKGKSPSIEDKSWMNTWGSILGGNFKEGCSVTAAFLDTGIDKDHLSATSWFNNTSAASTPSFSSPYDDHSEGHGTHTIGVTAQLVEACPNIDLLSIKTQDKNGKGTVWTAIKGIELAINNKATIINMSLAYFPKCVGTNEQPLATAMRISGEQYNVLCVTAAGNDTRDLNNSLGYSIYPSMFNLPNQINVGGLNENHSLVTPGANVWGTNHGNKYVNIGSFGVGINSAVRFGGFDRRDGTSAATPQVTTVASIIASLSCGKKTYAEIRNCILATATPYELPFSTGGYLNPDAAIRCYLKEGAYQGRIVKQNPKNTYSIYPNPFNEALNLEFNTNNETEIAQCTLYNLTGQMIQQTAFQGNINTTWDVENLPKGVYLLKIQHNGTQEIRKLIKQ